MKIPLNRQSAQPIRVQIRDYLSRLIQSGKLPSGGRLPSIRTLSTTIEVNKLTVIEAYSLLEADGLIHARPGSGYFVNTTVIAPTLKSNFAPSQKVIIQENGGGSFLEQFTASLQAQQHLEIIDFSSGFPHASGSDYLHRIAKRALAHAAEDLFRYDFPQGQLDLRQQISQMLVHQGLEVSSDELIVTNGSEQALSLVMRHYIQPGDWVIVETPTYHGALAILESLGAKVIGIPMTGAGMNLELLEQYLHTHYPQLIYTISTLHNPTGITTSTAHRQHLLTLAHRYACPILEDNAYEGLNFEPVPAPIKASDSQDLVTYTSTFSKTLMPGLRVGYLIPTKQHYRHLVKQKLLSDLHSATVSQAIVREFLASGQYRRHLSRLRTHNLQSRNVMLQALSKYFPEGVSWTVPQGGFFLWVHLPDMPIAAICRDAIAQSASALRAIAQNILIATGAAFFPDQQGYPAMRLNFSRSPQEIEQGISILGKLLKRYLISDITGQAA